MVAKRRCSFDFPQGQSIERFYHFGVSPLCCYTWENANDQNDRLRRICLGHHNISPSNAGRARS
jgi:hypothetical protein